MNGGSLRVKFVALWALLLVAKLLLAANLPIFVDEAFYAWESRHPAWAYSDLPGLTAALIGFGRAIAGESLLAMRAAFLVLGAALPWLVVRITARWFGPDAGWRAGLLALLMPLSGLLGVLAMPDVPLVFATLLCVDAAAGLRERRHGYQWLLLALGLVLGALSHYRFLAVIAAMFVAAVVDPRSRALLRDPRLWCVLAIGALAWWPLLDWNLAHAGAGLKFQLLERNPWRFQLAGAWWPLIQALAVTPILFAWLLRTACGLPGAARREPDGPWRLLLAMAIVLVAGYFLLGFFADNQRVSFHWPLAGWLLLVVADAGMHRSRARGWNVAGHAVAAVATLAVLAWLFAASSPAWRQSLADGPMYPRDFAVDARLAQMVDAQLAPGTRLVADNFELGAKLVALRDRDDVRVLDHASNHKHGRAAQLDAWQRTWQPRDARHAGPVLLVMDEKATPMKWLLQRYHAACAAMGPLPTPSVVEFDQGRQRFLLFRIDLPPPATACTTPAMGQIDFPAPGASVAPVFEVAGWAFKDGAGLARVDVTLDGRVVAEAVYGDVQPHVAAFWKISTDPHHPRVGFHARIDATGLPRGSHRLGLQVYDASGRPQPLPAQRVEIVDAPLP